MLYRGSAVNAVASVLELQLSKGSLNLRILKVTQNEIAAAAPGIREERLGDKRDGRRGPFDIEENSAKRYFETGQEMPETFSAGR